MEPSRPDPRRPVDDFRPRWSGFAAFFRDRTDLPTPYLTELHHARDTRHAWTVGQWRSRVEATADWLRGQGIGSGDAVATLAGNTAEALAVAYGCWLIGACCVPLNAQEATDRQVFVLRDSAARLLVHAPEQAERAAALAEATALPLHHTDGLPTESRTEVADAAVGLDVAALRLYTSGTTGEPKGIITTVGNLLTDLDALAHTVTWGRDTRVYTVLPVHHANALVISSLLPWHTGASTVLTDRFRTERFWADIAAERATTASLVPTLLEFLLAADGEAPEGFAEVLCGAGPLLVETALDFEQRFTVPIRHIYGLSETTCVAAAMPALPAEQRRHWHADFGFPSIGRALPHARMAVLHPVTGAELPAEVRGELAVRGAIIMREYAGRPDATADAFRGGWFHTGDEGFWRPGPDGHPVFFITGRMKELIIRGGHNISPFEIDEVLRTHPRVAFALAVPFEHRVYGDEIAAYVVAAGPLTAREVLDHCAARLDFAHQPKVVVFGDDVPYTATGKAKRLELKSRLAAELAAYRDVAFRRPKVASEEQR
ncbi:MULTISPECIES: class I adenylate-forming enzyme family protein [Micromonospora]|uniref:Long-chain fatty acid--CoA ligase n=1 Tax=Micromonospora solifontis TaxID=2487138 RepID=A0ABX9WLA3_9ACTN|nr:MULTISPECIES: class I adenylate-forming enzyme family protein [Micromonospora]NES14891.1 acyl--CoA ligase [Micromonospora sp. PPF5-17B]NES35186.1 acyl--CoA ligase [Micromonospora solifontis]NES55181.1 acyl--CoA ligase [Micromonospora sp. PPF5-6]RNM01165.1 long-chain fatty acid--CoA ligase [Micromonospora solifontis]